VCGARECMLIHLSFDYYIHKLEMNLWACHMIPKLEEKTLILGELGLI
jgi:hypothetical protein